MAWRMAKSLDRLLAQINAKWPKRRKDSDGGIGNAEHSARTSDHNPDTDGVVKARDFTHDPASGCDSYKLAQTLLDSRDPRIKYVISNRRIASGSDGPSPWVWRKYNGANPHDHHCHVSVKKDKKFFDDTSDWKLDSMPVEPPETVPAKSVVTPVPPTVKRGSRNATVTRLQKLLKIEADSYFGKDTKTALIGFQTKKGLTADGICGPQTWKVLLGIT